MMGMRGMSRGPGRPPLSNIGAMPRWVLMMIKNDNDDDDDDGHDSNDDGEQDDGPRQPRWASPQCERSA